MHSRTPLRLLLVLLGSISVTASSTGCFFFFFFIFPKREQPGLPLSLLLENEDHPDVSPSYAAPSKTLASPASRTSIPGEVIIES